MNLLSTKSQTAENITKNSSRTTNPDSYGPKLTNRITFKTRSTHKFSNLKPSKLPSTADMST